MTVGTREGIGVSVCVDVNEIGVDGGAGRFDGEQAVMVASSASSIEITFVA